MRFFLFGLLLALGGCDSGAAPPSTPGFSATVRGARTLDLRGDAFFDEGGSLDAWSLLLVGRSGAVVSATVFDTPLAPGTVGIPDIASAGLDVLASSPVYFEATEGTLVVTSVEATAVRGTVSFSAREDGGDAVVTVEAGFTARRLAATRGA